MARQQPPSPQPISPTEVEDHNLPVDSIETIRSELEARASTTTEVLHEILARDDDRYYVSHWGINE